MSLPMCLRNGRLAARSNHALAVSAIRGFSLIELLVVIVIIAVLTALLGAGIASARTSWERLRCASHMRTIGSTLLQYASDNNGVLPHVYAGSFTSGSSVAAQASYWPNFLRDAGYLSRAQIAKLTCPSQPINPNELIKSHYGFYMADPQGQMVKDDGGASGSVYRLRAGAHSSPSTCIVLADSLGKDGFQSSKIYQAALYQSGAIHTRHGQAANLFFFDGHIEAANADRLKELKVPGYYDDTETPILLTN